MYYFRTSDKPSEQAGAPKPATELERTRMP